MKGSGEMENEFFLTLHITPKNKSFIKMIKGVENFDKVILSNEKSKNIGIAQVPGIIGCTEIDGVNEDDNQSYVKKIKQA